jgi:hypothetical protein
VAAALGLGLSMTWTSSSTSWSWARPREAGQRVRAGDGIGVGAAAADAAQLDAEGLGERRVRQRDGGATERLLTLSSHISPRVQPPRQEDDDDKGGAGEGEGAAATRRRLEAASAVTPLPPAAALLELREYYNHIPHAPPPQSTHLGVRVLRAESVDGVVVGVGAEDVQPDEGLVDVLQMTSDLQTGSLFNSPTAASGVSTGSWEMCHHATPRRSRRSPLSPRAELQCFSNALCRCRLVL